MTDKKESGIVNMLVSCLTIFVTLILLLCCIGFSHTVQLKLQMDTLAKKYLYQMEARGYMSPDDYSLMEQEFESLGVAITDVGTTKLQVPYGGKVTLAVACKFDNPMLQYFNQDAAFGLSIFEEEQNYTITMEATAKW